MAAFLGIEFLEKDGGGLALVNSNWLTPRRKEVWWPPFKQQEQFDKSLKKGETPDESWTLYGIFKSYFEEEDYKKATIKLKKAELTSDVQSEPEPSQEAYTKRKRVPPKRLFSSDEDSESEGDIKSCRLPKVSGISPLLKAKKLKSGTNNEVVATTITKSTCQISGEQNSSYTQNFETPRECSQVVEPFTDDILGCTFSAAKEDGDFKKRIVTLLVQVKNQNSEILKLLYEKQTGSLVTNKLPADIPVKLPVQSIREVEIFEEYLRDENKLSAVTLFCCKLGGRDLTCKTNIILRSLISNRVAAEYSFLGSRAHKRSFHKLNMRKIVLNAVLATSSQANENEIDGFIKVWLKHAPKRLQQEEKRQRNL